MTHIQAVTLLLFQKAFDPHFRVGEKRESSKDLDSMIRRLKSTAEEWLLADWREDEVKEICRKTIENIGTERLRKYAKQVFDDCVREQSLVFSVSRGAPPTQKQLSMLRSLGCREVVETSSAASAIIGRLVAQRKKVRA